jgi:hypothetical protein
MCVPEQFYRRGMAAIVLADFYLINKILKREVDKLSQKILAKQ